jgi:hypothetical protein
MDQNLSKIFKAVYKETDESLQEALIALKQAGCSQITTIKIIIAEMNLSLSDADKIILNSKAWSAEKDATIKLRDAFGESLPDE